MAKPSSSSPLVDGIPASDIALKVARIRNASTPSNAETGGTLNCLTNDVLKDAPVNAGSYALAAIILIWILTIQYNSDLWKKIREQAKHHVIATPIKPATDVHLVVVEAL